MRYFSDERLAQMRENIKDSVIVQNSGMYLAYLRKIEDLDKRNDQFGDCREQLLQAIAELEKLSEGYIHRGRALPEDEDADAYEYENYDYRSTDD